jgi:maltodextrin utilization protein YvdJ
MLSVKLCCVAFAALLAVLLGLALAHFVTLDMTAFIGVVAATLVVEALLLVGVLALAFKRFDPSRLQPSDA